MSSNKVYYTPGTPVTFGSNSDTILWTPKALASGNARISNVWDRGAGSLPGRYLWRFKTKWVATPTGLDYVFLFAVSSSASATPALTDGGITFGDGAVTSTALLYNTSQFGGVYAEAVDKAYGASGTLYLYERYVAIAAYMYAAAKALTNTDADHQLILTPIPDDVQAAA
jgi:hypothetical protein